MSTNRALPTAAGRRRAVSFAPEALVSSGPLLEGQPLPLVIRPATRGVDLVTWAAAQRPWIDAQLLRHGAVLLRGFELGGAERFEQLIAATSGGKLLEYTYRSTPRSNVAGRIYTSTEYPADQFIPWHNENSYTNEWPRKLYFYSRQVALEGGETPIVDSRRVHERISTSLRDRFTRRGVRYVRNYGSGLDLPWETVFQTSDRGEVERYCEEHDIELTWGRDGSLRTEQVCQAVVPHPATGEMVWFNQAHLFHVSSLPAEVRDALLEQLGEDGLPRNTYYGDGSPIEASALDEIRAAYQREQVTFAWEPEDVLIVDNMLVAHGRMPYRGPRQVLVGMAEGFRASR
jgi:alpha-ketoglutarate-dependent taurine dioxygenase